MNNQFSRFLLVGVFNTLFGWIIIFGGMYLLQMSPEASNVLGYSIGLLASFVQNRTFIFRSSGRPSGELARFLAVFALAFGANLATLFVLVRFFFVHETASQLVAGVVYVISSYMMNNNFVFQQLHSDQGAGTLICLRSTIYLWHRFGVNKSERAGGVHAEQYE